jgi:hypothetical protein
MSFHRTLTRATAAAVAALACTAVPALAADKPAPCSGKLLVTDPVGDAFVGFVGLVESPAPAGPNVDITGVFVNSKDGRVTFNIVVNNLDTAVGPGATANVYRLNYDVGDASNYLQARVDATGVAYSYGHSETSGLVKDGDGKGTFYEGKDGVIEIEVPATHGGKPGAKWAGASLFTAYVRGAVNTQTDEAPDAGGTFNYNGAACPSTPAPGGGTGTPPATGAPAPPAAPAPGSGPTQPASQPTGPLRISVKPAVLKAAKVKRARKVAFSIRPSETMRDLTITLKRGSAKVSSAKLAELQGARTVSLKLRKGLRKGAYALVITAKRPDGSTATATVRIRVK